MRLLEAFTTPVVVADAASALPFPPVVFGSVVDWKSLNIGAVPEFDLDIWSLGTLSLTDAEVFGGVPRTFVYADQVVTCAASTNLLTKSTHGLFTGDGPLRLSNVGGVLAGGTAAATDYWVIKGDANTFKLAASLADALSGAFIDLSSDSTGTTTISDTSSTQRVYWQSFGLLQDDISLTANRAFSVRCSHRPDVIAYALFGTLSAGSVSVAVTPVQDR